MVPLVWYAETGLVAPTHRLGLGKSCEVDRLEMEHLALMRRMPLPSIPEMQRGCARLFSHRSGTSRHLNRRHVAARVAGGILGPCLAPLPNGSYSACLLEKDDFLSRPPRQARPPRRRALPLDQTPTRQEA